MLMFQLLLLIATVPKTKSCRKSQQNNEQICTKTGILSHFFRTFPFDSLYKNLKTFYWMFPKGGQKGTLGGNELIL